LQTHAFVSFLTPLMAWQEESQEESLSTDLEMNHLGYPLGEAHYKYDLILFFKP
jgi:hypothetical protein